MSAVSVTFVDAVLNRGVGYVFALLLAIILTLLPSAIWADLAVPMADSWENWYWKGQPYPRPHFTLQNPPRLLRAELSTYKLLVMPPGYLRRLVTGWPTAYAINWISPYRETAGLPPLAFTLEHSSWALPLWAAILTAVYELFRAVVRRGKPRAG